MAMIQQQVQQTDNFAQRSCSYCHRSPTTRHGNNNKLKLKRCSRCHRAWYCNVDCQKKHFSVHKNDCKQWAAAAARKTPTNDNTKTATRSTAKCKFVVQKREGRGNCLVVAPGQSIRKGERILDYAHNAKDYWEPLLLPVLHHEHRSSRCALCFGRLAAPESCYTFDNLPPNPLYPIVFCSTKCRKIASSKGMEQEAKDCLKFVQTLRGKKGPKYIFSTAILLYRILVLEQKQGDEHILEQVRSLQGTPHRERSQTNNNHNAEDSNNNNYHTQGVIAMAMGMLQSSACPSMEYLSEMVHRIKVNGFSIYSESHFESIGLGLYGTTPSFMNHSCRANVLQAFGLNRPGHLPSLYLTAFSDISANQEICISYTDASCPSHMRQKHLETEYHFRCNCQACDANSSHQDDKITMGLKCKNAGCCQHNLTSSSCSTVIRGDRGMAPNRTVYECSQCHATDFESALQQLQVLEQTVSNSTTASSKALHDTYQRLQTICYTHSWYVQEAGEKLLQDHLDRLEGDVEQAWKALKLAEDLLNSSSSSSSSNWHNSSSSSSSTSSFLRHQHLKHKTAKLRLFLVADPRQSIQQLQEVLACLEPYFPQDHVVIAEVKASLASGMM